MFVLDAASALLISEKILAIALLLHSVEFYLLRHSYSENGIWSWNDIKDDFSFLPKPFRFLFDITLSYKSFLVLLLVRFLVSACLLVVSHYALLLIALFITVLVLIRWRGNFNGGSDYMLMVVISGLTLASCFPESQNIVLGALYYIAIQATASFFIAGVVKLKRPSWRKGQALPEFLKISVYKESPLIRWVLNRPRLLLLGSWLVIIFECSFPLVFVSVELCMLYLTLATVFQLMNIYFFGLNRFLWVWWATYPALIWVSLG